MGKKQPKAAEAGRSRRSVRRDRAARAAAAGGGAVPEAARAADVSRALAGAVCAALAIVILAIYARTFGYGFVAYDDKQYVYENPVLRGGLSAANVAWAFTTFYFANWHPLTWISYMLDVQLFGVDPGEMHAVNVLLHFLTSALLFLALARMTRRPWLSALAAVLFAAHPLHVESVAWIAERKDALSAFFAALTLFLYAGYAKAPTAARYAAVAAAFALSLMAKPMAVTLPLVLLLLDFWPLARLSRRAVLEKLPLIAMTAAASALTFVAQRNYGTVAILQRLPLSARISNATVSYIAYIAKTVWPVNLAAFYPFHLRGGATVMGAAAALAAVTAAAVKWAGRHPYFLTGWLWYLGMLTPVIGIVQVGDQGMADRYAYLPMVGLSIAVIWTAAGALERRPRLQRAAAALSVVALAALTATAANQAAYWKDSRTLFEHALAVTDRNYIMANNLGFLLESKDQPSPQAEAMFRKSVAFNPDYVDGQANLGRELLKSGRVEEAYDHLAAALRLNPKLATSQSDLSVALMLQGKYEEAQPHVEESLRLDPAQPEAQNDMCFLLLHFGHPAEAAAHCREALRLKPDYAFARTNLANALAAQGGTGEAKK